MIKILAIDDINDNLIILKAIIKDAFPDSIVVTASNGIKGIELGIAEDPDVILLDIIMPGMDGFEVCRLLKQDERVSYIPVVFITALKGDKEDRIKALEAGAEGFLTKPVDMTELTAQIRAMVKIKSANEQSRNEKVMLNRLVFERTRELEQSQLETLLLLDNLKAENENHKLTENALLESKENFKAIANYAASWEAWFNPEGKLIWMNPYSVKLTGYTPEEYIAAEDYLLMAIAPEDKNLVSEKFQEALNGSSGDNLEIRNLRKDGSVFWVSVSWQPILNANGQSLGFRTSAQDITERKQAEEQLKIQKRFFEQIFSQSSVSTQILDKDGWCERINPKLSEIFGVKPEHIEGKVYNIFKDEGIRQGGVLPHLEKVFKQGKTAEWEVFFDLGIASESQQIEVAEKKKVWYQNWAYPIFDEMNNLTHVIIQHSDITERKQAEEGLRENEIRLRELNATKDKFFSIIAHDLKSPFNSILGLSNLLVEQIQEKDFNGIEEYAGIIRDSSQRAMDLLMNLLEWSRSQTGRMEFNPEYIEIIGLINDATELHFDAAQQKSISISLEIPRKTLVFADKAMIATILRNMISNAVKFTHPGGQIIISSEQKENELWITITDNGVGIKKTNLEKLFRLDQNLSTLGTKNEKGTGLGLLLCKEFVEKHGGQIRIESEPGKGSTFGFSIPKH